MNRQTLFLCLLALILAGCGASAERRMIASAFPIYGNGGKPDLTVDARLLADTMKIEDRKFSAKECAIEEGAVASAGVRRLLLFDTAVLNMGDGDLVVGDRSDPDNIYANLFEYAPCHEHFHISDFSQYELLRASDRTVAAAARKQGFCFRDNLNYSGGFSNQYFCSNQGITSGWADLYDQKLDGQWIDITGVPEGDYILRVTINISGSFDEGQDRYPNTAEVRVHIPAPDQKPGKLAVLP